MTKKKLQLQELKVKSFVTVVDKSEQKTTKGGIINVNTQGYIMEDIGGHTPWTEWKTRLGSPDDVLRTHFLGNSGKAKG